MAYSDSITELFNDICNLHLKDQPRAFLVQPKCDRHWRHDFLKKKLYNTYFESLVNLRAKKSLKDSPIPSEVDDVLSYVFNLRLNRQFDEANRLENLLDKLTELKSKSDDIFSILKFITCLKNSVPPQRHSKYPVLGLDSSQIPIVYNSKDEDHCLPEGPNYYGDSRTQQHDSMWYMHYPRYIFEQKIPSLNEKEEKNRNLFELTPGSSLSGDGLFNVKGYMNDDYEQKNKYTLYGALVQSQITSVDVKLEFPDFQDVVDQPPEIRIPKAMSSSQLSEDEGFEESKSDIFSSTTTLDNFYVDDDNIWEKALKHEPNQHYTWERVGLEPNSTELPYATEAGPETCDKIWLFKSQELSLLCPQDEFTLPVLITQECLVKDVLNLLIGVPSHTFFLDDDSSQFQIKPGVYVSGFTPQALKSFLLEFMECGSTYRQLDIFSQPLTIDSFFEAGLVFQAFTTAIRKVLQHYRGVVLNISPESTLMEVKYMCHRIFVQLRYLIKLTQYKIGSRFPKGIELISYLYQETLEANSTDNYPMMLCILQTTCGPFTLFLQNWVFHGIFQDLYGEFTIQVNHQFLECRDRRYWTSSYTLTSNNIEDCVPIFLNSIANDIIVCGKTLNLLKLCCHDHFMCNVNEKDIPRVTITFSEEDLKSIDTSSQIYISRMEQIARQTSLSRQENIKRKAQAKHDLMERANKLKMQEIVRLQNIITSQKRAADIKKREEFQRLKNQMQTDLQRRAADIEEIKSNDKQYMESFTKREEIMTEEEKRLEEEVRKEVIAYYAELGEEATRREQKALWKLRRAHLELERTKFLMDDADYWEKEMMEHKEAERQLHSVEVKLPEWTENISYPVSDKTYPEDIVTPDAPTIISDVPSDELTEEIAVMSDPVDIESPQDEVNSTEQSKDTALSEGITLGLKDDPEQSLAPSEEVKEIEEGTILHSDDEPIPNLNTEPDDKDIHVEDIKLDVTESPTKEDKEEDISEHVMTSSSPMKATVKLYPSKSASQETQSSTEKYHIKLSNSTDAMKESQEVESKPNIKRVENKHASLETAESDKKSSIKYFEDKHHSKETVEEDRKPSIKYFEGKHHSKETEEEEKRSQIRINPHLHHSAESENTSERPIKQLKPGASHASDQTQQKEWKIKPQSQYGHASQMSVETLSNIPKLKRAPKEHYSFEPDFKEFMIKPKIKISKTLLVNRESEPADVGPKIRKNVNLNMHPSKETEFIDHDKIRGARFRERNIFGHASDSSVQKLMYGNVKENKAEDFAPLKQLLPAEDWPIHPVEPYETEFNMLTEFPKVDLTSSIPFASFGSFGDYGISKNDDVEKYKYLSLPSILKQSMMTPLKAQISLVNKCAVDYFFMELKLEDHFETLRRYLLMEDGDFSQMLSDALFEKLATNPLPQELMNPVFLNGVLKKSLQSSMYSNDKNIEQLSFVLRFLPTTFSFTSFNTLDCLELRYKVDWPINIILTDNYMTKYGQVFSFMLQLKRTVWVLKDVWYKLKRDALVKKVGNSPQFRQLQLFRQEMQHFVKVMQGYIANQIIHVTWQEFQESLSKDVRDLDDLYRVHGQYLEKAIFRCLLNKKAKPVMKIIQDIFSLILKFRMQLLNGSWQAGDCPGNLVLSNFQQILSSYNAFRQYSVFLFVLVNKLAIRGYQPHLQELLLRLNFNNYYKDQKS